MKVHLDELKRFCTAALEKAGMNPEYAAITADVLSETDAFGVHSHGVRNLYTYTRKAAADGLDIQAEPEVVKSGLAFAVIDAKHGMGMAPSVQAMELACQKAEQTGIGIVTVKNSTHFGANGYYANVAAKKGMIGLAISNVNPNMNAPGAKANAIGNSPFAFACPAKTIPTVFLDIALSTVAGMKVIQARESGQKIPTNWIVDKDGLPTDDPSRFPQEGALLPMAAHKGYGLAVMVEVLTGVLCGGATSMSGGVFDWIASLDKPNNISHTFIAVNAALFCDESDLAERVETMSQELRDLPLAKGSDRIYLPGEIEWARFAKAEKEGVELPPDAQHSLEKLAETYNLTLTLVE